MVDESNPQSRKPSQSQFALSDASWLALSSAAAYAVAFLFETGFADCYGYPHWLIDIGFSNVMLGWINIVLALLACVILYFFIGAFASTRWLSVLFLNRVFLMFVAAVLTITIGLLARPWPFWLGITYYSTGSVLLVLTTLTCMAAYRRTDQNLPAFERVKQAIDKISPPISSAGSSLHADFSGSLLGRTIASPVLGRLYAWGFVLLIPAGIIMLAANEFGHFRASNQSEFWISSDSLPLVALRRYGDKIIATPWLIAPSAWGASPIKVVSWESNDRVWTLRSLTARGRQRLSCR